MDTRQLVLTSSPTPPRFHHEETPFRASARRIAWALIVITRVTSLCLNWRGNATAHISCILPSDGEVWRGWILISHERWNGVKTRTDFIYFFITRSTISNKQNMHLVQSVFIAASQKAAIMSWNFKWVGQKWADWSALYVNVARSPLDTMQRQRQLWSNSEPGNLKDNLRALCASRVRYIFSTAQKEKRKGGDADYVCVPAAGVRAHYFHC